MTNKIVLLFAGILFSLTVSAQSMKSKWSTTPITIDGKSSDWGEILSMYNTSMDALYEIRNDSNNLYLVFQFIEKETQMKSMTGGFLLEFYAKTKPKLKAAIVFPTMQKPEKMKTTNAKGENWGDMQMQYRLQSRQANVRGFLKTKHQIERSEHSNKPFTYNIGWDKKGDIVYEICIPYSELFETSAKLEDVLSQQLKITPKLKALERPQMSKGKGQGGRSGGGMRQGGGMRPQGGMPSGGMGRPGGNSQNMQKMLSDQSFKIKLQMSSAE